MPRRSLWLALLLCAGPAGAKPRLLVVVSVDQMRADYVDRTDVVYSSGLKTLFETGAVWTRASHTHVPTETGPGHAVILTGRAPDGNGIAANDWWDARASTWVYCVSDSVHGLGPENLRGYTLGDALKAKNPASRVVSLSMKDRAAILMGGKKADAAIWYDKNKREFTTSSYYGVRPAWLDDFNAKSAPAARSRDLLLSPEGDSLLLDLAERAMSEYHLGEGDGPDILAVSFSVTDYIGHKHGPDSPEMRAQLKHLDGVLGELIGYLKVNVGAGKFDLALTADHGVQPVPESPAGKAMGARRLLWDRFEADVEKALQARHPAAKKRWLTAFSYPGLHLDRELAKASGLEWSALLKDAAKAIAAIDGVASVYMPGDWDASDEYTPVYRRSFFPGRTGDLLVRFKEGVLLTEEKKGTEHGSPYPYDARVPLIFFGPDFKTGLYGIPVPVAALAPTLGRLLDLDYPAADGARILKESLVKP